VLERPVGGPGPWHDAGVKTASGSRKPGKARKQTAAPAGSKKGASGKPRKTAAGRPAGKRAAGNGAMKRGGAGARMAASKPIPRADFGAPIDGFFRKQPPPLRPILEALRRLVEEAAPDAASSIKWGMPFYNIGPAMVCALGAHRSHVNLILSGPPDAFDDPEGRLSGTAKTGRHLKLTSVDELPRASVRRWLRTAAELARRKGR
jgi:hypothetical protein